VLTSALIYVYFTGIGLPFQQMFLLIPPNPTVLHPLSVKIYTKNFCSPLSKLCSPLSALRSTLTYLSFPFFWQACSAVDCFLWRGLFWERTTVTPTDAHKQCIFVNCKYMLHILQRLVNSRRTCMLCHDWTAVGILYSIHAHQHKIKTIQIRQYAPIQILFVYVSQTIRIQHRGSKLNTPCRQEHNGENLWQPCWWRC
jgi:hypothetical protein